MTTTNTCQVRTLEEISEKSRPPLPLFTPQRWDGIGGEAICPRPFKYFSQSLQRGLYNPAILAEYDKAVRIFGKFGKKPQLIDDGLTGVDGDHYVICPELHSRTVIASEHSRLFALGT
ncbi:hypothetical protein thsps21_34690 [Pseudomonas sp. No.21]|nr:hypothetical protein TUM20249_18360 [Pseudomonas tohonis]